MAVDAPRDSSLVLGIELPATAVGELEEGATVVVCDDLEEEVNVVGPFDVVEELVCDTDAKVQCSRWIVQEIVDFEALVFAECTYPQYERFRDSGRVDGDPEFDRWVATRLADTIASAA